jgi:hypothetical protein
MVARTSVTAKAWRAQSAGTTREMGKEDEGYQYVRRSPEFHENCSADAGVSGVSPNRTAVGAYRPTL